MKTDTVLNICLKVLGVFYALKALNMLPSTISQVVLTWDVWQQAGEHDPLRMMVNYKVASMVSVLIPILLFVIALFLVFKSENIVRFLCSRQDLSSDAAIADNLPMNAMTISIKIFGFFSVLSAVPHLSNLLSRYWIMRENLRLYDNTGKIELASSAICTVLYVGVGLLLIFFSSALAKKLLAIDVKKETGLDTIRT
jgi:hypothetical protein